VGDFPAKFAIFEISLPFEGREDYRIISRRYETGPATCAPVDVGKPPVDGI